MKVYDHFVAVVLFSCKSGKKSVFTPTSSGRAYEVLVVVEKPVWERPAGRALYNVLDTDVPGLPQSERECLLQAAAKARKECRSRFRIRVCDPAAAKSFCEKKSQPKNRCIFGKGRSKLPKGERVRN